MSSVRLLAFSSSRVGKSAYLESVVPVVTNFLGPHPLKIAFIPFASVDGYDAYLEKVVKAFEGTPYSFTVTTSANATDVVAAADVIMVGGGNTFKLLHDLYALNVLEVIQEKVKGGAPYIGWSAGSNITGLSIATTNDMPVIEPKSFKALGFFPFQINPHYLNEIVEGHNGETRDQRLEEFVKLNPAIPVVGLPEGTFLHLEKNKITYEGIADGMLLVKRNSEGDPTKSYIAPGTDLSYLSR